MVPHSSSIANFKSDEKLKSADILTQDRQFLGKLAWISRIGHHTLNASQKHLLPAMARLCGRQWQQFLCFNTNTYPLRSARRPQYQWCLSCSICEYTYNKLRTNLTSTFSSAAGIHYPVRDHAHECGTMQPGQSHQEPQFSRSSQAELLIQQRLKCKQPPRPDGCLASIPNRTSAEPHLMLVRYR